MNVIEVQDLRRDFGEIQAVKGVTFAVEEGEIFGFLGPNGAGKTTTINMLCTLLHPTAGQRRSTDLTWRASAARCAVPSAWSSSSPPWTSTSRPSRTSASTRYAYAIPPKLREQRIPTCWRWSSSGDRRKGSGADLLGRHEAPAGDRARAPAPPPRPVPGRADAGPGPADPAPHLGLPAQAPRAGGADHLHDNALHGRGGELRSDRRHRPRPDRGARHAGRSEERRRWGPHHVHHDDNAAAAEKRRIDTRSRPPWPMGRCASTYRDGEHFLPEFVRTFPQPMLSVGLQRPTLDDVFLTLTGHEIRDTELDSKEMMLAGMGRRWGR